MKRVVQIVMKALRWLFSPDDDDDGDPSDPNSYFQVRAW